MLIISAICSLLFSSDLLGSWTLPWLKEWLYDLSMGILSALVLGIILEIYNNRYQEKLEREREEGSLKTAIEVLNITINDYYLSVYELTTPMQKRFKGNDAINFDFTIHDLEDMFEKPFILKKNIFGTTLEEYLRSEKELVEDIEYFLSTNTFKYHSKIENCLIKFLKISKALSQRSRWEGMLDTLVRVVNLDPPDFVVRGTSQQKIFTQLLKDRESNLQEMFDSGDVSPHNAMETFNALRKLIRHQLALLEEYKSLTKNLVSPNFSLKLKTNQVFEEK